MLLFIMRWHYGSLRLYEFCYLPSPTGMIYNTLAPFLWYCMPGWGLWEWRSVLHWILRDCEGLCFFLQIFHASAITNELREICRKTSIINDPSKLPQEAHLAANLDVKWCHVRMKLRQNHLQGLPFSNCCSSKSVFASVYRWLSYCIIWLCIRCNYITFWLILG